MKAKMKKVLALMVIIATLCSSFAGVASAASKNHKVYKEYLSHSSVAWGNNTYKTKHFRYKEVDLNQDGKTELIVENNDAYTYDGFMRLYTVYKGKLKCIWEPQRSYEEIYEYNKSKSVICTYAAKRDMEHYSIYKVKSSKTKLIACKSRNIMTGKCSYWVNGKNVNKKTYLNKTSKYTKKGLTKLKMKKNPY